MALPQAFRLNEQLQLLRISSSEYRLISLFDSLTVKANEATAGVLDHALPALERGADLASLERELPEREADAVRALVEELDTRGIVEHALPEEDEAEASGRRAFASQRRFFANFQAVGDMSDSETELNDAARLQGRLSAATVMVMGLGRVGSQVTHALRSMGVGRVISAENRTLENSPANLDFLVLCEDAFDPDHHAAINRAALDKKVPWIGYRLLRTRLEIGPTVIPYETACFHCYELRRISNSAGFADELELQRRLVANDTDLGALNLTLGADLLALETVKSLTHFTSAATYGHVYVMDILSLETQVRPILKIPRCPECGAASKKPQSNVWSYDSEREGARV